jgi:hypothetical protein
MAPEPEGWLLLERLSALAWFLGLGLVTGMWGPRPLGLKRDGTYSGHLVEPEEANPRVPERHAAIWLRNTRIGRSQPFIPHS